MYASATHKRPRSSFVRFEASLPNELWQADTTHWRLADGTDVEILDLIDDHSRLLLAADASGRSRAAMSSGRSWPRSTLVAPRPGC